MQEVISPHNAHRLLTNVNFSDLADGSCELNISFVHSETAQTDCDITAIMDSFISVGYLSVAEFCCN